MGIETNNGGVKATTVIKQTTGGSNYLVVAYNPEASLPNGCEDTTRARPDICVRATGGFVNGFDLDGKEILISIEPVRDSKPFSTESSHNRLNPDGAPLYYARDYAGRQMTRIASLEETRRAVYGYISEMRFVPDVTGWQGAIVYPDQPKEQQLAASAAGN